MNHKSKFAKTDARHWREKLTTRGSDELHVRICFGGVQRWWPLKTANREQAAEKARAIWLSLIREGFDVAEAKHKPWTVPQADDKADLTVGKFLEAVRAVAAVRPTTLTSYERKFRFLVSQIASVKGNRSKFDYVHGGANKWRARVDAVPLADLTCEAISQWRVRYVAQADDNALKRQQAQQTAISIIRNAKALFAPKVLRSLKSVKLPSPLPFDGVELGKRPRTRYSSKINAGALVAAAHAELKEQQPEQFKIFLLAFGAGLRRGEIDRLLWNQFRWSQCTLSIEANEYGQNKSDASNEEIDLGTDLVNYFKQAMADTNGDFVVESKAAPTAAPHWNRYRCDGHFKDLLEWLRSKGVTTRNPLHTLRKEFGSLINKKFGIFAASAALRHSNISITREAYVDRKERIALDLSELVQTQN
jgi:integrase